jgi:hypothetical protein
MHPKQQRQDHPSLLDGVGHYAEPAAPSSGRMIRLQSVEPPLRYDERGTGIDLARQHLLLH